MNLGRDSPPNSPYELSPLPFRYAPSLWTGFKEVFVDGSPVHEPASLPLRSVGAWRPSGKISTDF